jgi:hypothetical protein
MFGSLWHFYYILSLDWGEGHYYYLLWLMYSFLALKITTLYTHTRCIRILAEGLCLQNIKYIFHNLTNSTRGR